MNAMAMRTLLAALEHYTTLHHESPVLRHRHVLERIAGHGPLVAARIRDGTTGRLTMEQDMDDSHLGSRDRARKKTPVAADRQSE